MAIFNRFPYSNAHELNLDWILEQIKNLEQPGDLSPEYVQQQLQIFNVKDFGAVGDGITDDTNAIQEAIAAVPESGGIVFLPAGEYMITSSLILGNGSNTDVSSINNIQLIGEGGQLWAGAVLPNTNLSGTRLAWYGAASNAMLEVHGPINGVRVSDIVFNCRSIADYGIRIFCAQFGDFSRITVANANRIGLDVTQWAAQDGSMTSNNIMCRFSQLSLFCPEAGSGTCLHVGGDSGNLLNDTNMCTFENVALFRSPTGKGLHLDFTDASVMRNLIVWCNGVSTTGIDVLLDGSVMANFPNAWLFENISASIKAQGSIGMITCLGYGMGDGESIPDDLVHVAGWTHNHYTFGTWVPYTP